MRAELGPLCKLLFPGNTCEARSAMRTTNLENLTMSHSWTVGQNWPYDGEIDLYEGWNDMTENHPALHMKDSATYGNCKLTGVGQSAALITNNCDNGFQNPPLQWLNQGCVVNDNNGPWASANGGTCKSFCPSSFHHCCHGRHSLILCHMNY